MDYNNIANLIDQYFEGETSLQEEQLLKDYFSQDNIDPKLAHFKPLFDYLEEEASIALDEQFDVKILQQIEAQEETPKQSKVIPLRSPLLFRVAAAVALLLVAWWSYQSIDTESVQGVQAQKKINWEQFEPQTEAEAQQQLADAFRKIRPKKKKIDWSKFEPQSEEEALEWTAKAFRKLNSVNDEAVEATKQVTKFKDLGKFLK